MRQEFFIFSAFVIVLNILSYFYFPWFLWSLVIFAPVIFFGLRDCFQSSHTILRNFPVLGHFRYWLEMIRPEINQYFIESNTNGVPFSREQRSLVYQRAKKVTDTLPFGTQKNVYETGYEWVNHSINPIKYDGKDLRFTIGSDLCSKPYSASILNISAMSYGALSKTAIEALNGGAKIGNFAHNTGEGGLSPYHLKQGGDVIWQIGTGYFGCRAKNGTFDAGKFKENASKEAVKMIEIKLSQGAKPGKGGMVPGEKVTQEIADIRGVEVGKTVFSPPGHSAFRTPVDLIHFVQKLRELSGGKPVGIKLCLGKRREFIALCKAIQELKIYPDYITIDGGEGGTGAAPVEFSNNVGFPLREGLVFAHNILVGFDLRKKIRLICSGGVISGFDVIRRIALGADACNSARAMMLALGCIQALRCNSNHCPTGVATQNPKLYKGIVVSDKKIRVANYHSETIHSIGELLGAMGLSSPEQLRPWHIMRRTNFNEVKHYGEIYQYLKPGDLLKEPVPSDYSRPFRSASPLTFEVPSHV